MKLPLEDEFSDILSKAQKGLGLSTDTLSTLCGLSEGDIRGLRRGDCELDKVDALARELGLRAEPLLAVARGDWYPAQPEELPGFRLFATPFYDWSVNAFVLWNEDSGKAVAFDTGTDAEPLIAFLKEKELELEAICLTHTHRDHIEGLEDLRRAFGMRVFVNEREVDRVEGGEAIREGFSITLAGYELEGIETPGHTEGGMTFVINGLPRPVAVVGDALFAGSMGGANVSYEAALQGIDRLLGLPETTVLAPGHGPLTTVAEERRMNCFWNPARRTG